MKTYLFDTLNRFRRFSENLDVKATLCNRPWQVFNDSGEKELYIFQEDGTLLITYSGRVTHSTWQYIAANKSIVISAGEQSYMVHPAFMDNVLFALQVDGTNECAFLIDENNAQSFAPRSYTALMGYFEEKERKVLEEERRRRQAALEAENRRRLAAIEEQRKRELEEEQRRIKEKEEELWATARYIYGRSIYWGIHPLLYVGPLILSMLLPLLLLLFDIYEGDFDAFIYPLIIEGCALGWFYICSGINRFIYGSMSKKRLKKFAEEWTGDRTIIHYIVEEHNSKMKFPKDKVSVDELFNG